MLKLMYAFWNRYVSVKIWTIQTLCPFTSGTKQVTTSGWWWSSAQVSCQSGFCSNVFLWLSSNAKPLFYSLCSKPVVLDRQALLYLVSFFSLFFFLHSLSTDQVVLLSTLLVRMAVYGRMWWGSLDGTWSKDWNTSMNLESFSQTWILPRFGSTYKYIFEISNVWKEQILICYIYIITLNFIIKKHDEMSVLSW